MLTGWLLTSVQFLVGRGWQSFNASALSGWVSILYLGIFLYFSAYVFYYDALQNLSSASVGAYLYIEPIANMVIAFLVLAETRHFALPDGWGAHHYWHQPGEPNAALLEKHR
jgi:drug/metabolite transporter (DMT)-like permease